MYDDMQNWLDMTSHENPLLPQSSSAPLKPQDYENTVFKLGSDIE